MPHVCVVTAERAVPSAFLARWSELTATPIRIRTSVHEDRRGWWLVGYALGKRLAVFGEHNPLRAAEKMLRQLHESGARIAPALPKGPPPDDAEMWDAAMRLAG